MSQCDAVMFSAAIITGTLSFAFSVVLLQIIVVKVHGPSQGLSLVGELVGSYGNVRDKQQSRLDWIMSTSTRDR